MVGPGHAEHKSMKLISTGEIIPTGQVTPRLQRIEEVWTRAGFTVQSSADIHTQVSVTSQVYKLTAPGQMTRMLYFPAIWKSFQKIIQLLSIQFSL